MINECKMSTRALTVQQRMGRMLRIFRQRFVLSFRNEQTMVEPRMNTHKHTIRFAVKSTAFTTPTALSSPHIESQSLADAAAPTVVLLEVWFRGVENGCHDGGNHLEFKSGAVPFGQLGLVVRSPEKAAIEAEVCLHR
jgi:hypothetical protein